MTIGETCLVAAWALQRHEQAYAEVFRVFFDAYRELVWEHDEDGLAHDGDALLTGESSKKVGHALLKEDSAFGGDWHQGADK